MGISIGIGFGQVAGADLFVLAFALGFDNGLTDKPWLQTLFRNSLSANLRAIGTMHLECDEHTVSYVLMFLKI
jgi:hypothetical protein